MSEIKTVLVANNHLDYFGGSESYTYALAQELIVKGFDVEYFTFEKGNFAQKMEDDLGIKFMSKTQYDLILANHNTCVKHLREKGFIIQTCHGIYPELEQPSIFADFHVAISQEVANHLAFKGYRSVIIMNGIDMKRFCCKNEINETLTNVLSLCQSEEANDFLKGVCDSLGVKFTYLNKFENGIWNVEDLINENDMVIGLGRSAYEAMACGRPVIVFDKRPYSESFADGYVVDKLANSLVNNCSGRFYKLKMDNKMMEAEFLKYKKEDGFILKQIINDNFNIELIVTRYLEVAEDLVLKRKIFYRQSLFTYLKFKYGVAKALSILKYLNKNYYKSLK